MTTLYTGHSLQRKLLFDASLQFTEELKKYSIFRIVLSALVEGDDVVEASPGLAWIHPAQGVVVSSHLTS